MVSRKDFESIAIAIKLSTELESSDSLVDKEELIDQLVGFFKSENSKFNEELFREACKVVE